jgi:hypothetical protein
MTSRPASPPPPPTRYGRPPAGASQGAQVQMRPGAPPAAGSGPGYRLVVGAYMHQGQSAGRMPPELAGHGFVAIERPDGRREAFGFSPKNFGSFDPRRDFAKLSAGVPGVVHDDANAFSRPGVRTRAIPISHQQAQAALAKVNEYRTRGYQFSATRRQCSTFVNDVTRAAGVATGPAPSLPGALYQRL